MLRHMNPMKSDLLRPVLINGNKTPDNATQTNNSISGVLSFHEKLPGYCRSPLVSLPQLAASLSVRSVFAKLEYDRCGLPSFKILGASYATAKAISRLCKVPPESSLEELGAAARSQGLSLWAATDGNHGRAIARLASLMGIEATIYVPREMDAYTRKLIESEGATCIQTACSYDSTVAEVYRATILDEKNIMVQDVSFENYEEIPAWIVEGYSTMLLELEVDEQIQDCMPTHIITPVGVGSLAEAVVKYCRSKKPAIKVISVEPDTAACLYESIKTGARISIQTRKTIMDGMNCGTVSMNAWPRLAAGIDACITASDLEAHDGVRYLADTVGHSVGPCAGATIAALKRISDSESLGLDQNSVIVLLCTEGPREYEIPVTSHP